MIRMAWYSIKNRAAGSLEVILVIILILAALFTGLQLTTYLEVDLDRQQLRLGADYMLIPEQVNFNRQKAMMLTPFLNIYYEKDDVIKRMTTLGQNALLVPQFFVQTGEVPGMDGLWHWVGTDWEQDFILRAWHENYDSLPLAGKKVLVGYGWTGKLTGEVELFGEKYHVAGKLPETGTEIDRTIFMSLEDAWFLARQIPQLASLWQVKEWGGYHSPEGLVSAILVKAKNLGEIEELQEQMLSLKGAKPISNSTVLETTKGHLVVIKNIFYLFGMLLWTISIILLNIHFTARLFERKQELGMLMALGAQKQHLYQLLFLEIGIIAGLGVFFGGVTGLVTWAVVGKTFFGQVGLLTGWEAGWSLFSKLGKSGAAALLAPMVAVLFPVYRLSKWEAAALLNQREI